MMSVNAHGAAERALDELGEALHREALRGPLSALLAEHRGAFEALAELSDASALLARLDAMEPFTAARDALLADLIRLHRRTRDGAALGALVYALHGLLARRGLRFTSARSDLREGLAEILYALVERIESFEVDARSSNAQAGIERDILRRLKCASRRERRRQDRQVELDLNAEYEGFAYALELPELRLLSATPDNDAQTLDAEVVGALLEPLVARRILRERDAQIFGRVELLGQRAVEVAQELGMKPDAVRKALERVRRKLREHQARVETIFLSRLRGRCASTR